MKILIVHLSDFHIQSPIDSICCSMVDGMVDSLGDLSDYDGVIIAFTGDATQTGAGDQYKYVDNVFNRITERLAKTYQGKLGLFVIPGNHDLFFPDQESKKEASSVVDLKNWSDLEILARSQLERMSEYNAWAANYDCSFGNNQVITRSFSVGEGANERVIRVTMLNTVPVSTYKRPSDKDYHWIDSREIQRIRCHEDNDLHIIMLHHAPEWFNETLKRPLLDAICSTSDVLLVGHEHVDGLREMIDDEGRSLVVLEGGKIDFSPNGTAVFSAVKLDMGVYPYHIEETTYEWNLGRQQFSRASPDAPSLLVPKRGAIQPREEYIKTIRTDDTPSVLQASFEEYFIFPSLISSTDLETGRTSQIDDIDSFFEVIKENERICIRGKANAGKTTLIKMLYLKSLEKGYVPLLVSPNYSQASLRLMFKGLIAQQYGEGETVEHDFSDIPRGRKILFIDDFEYLRKERKNDSAYLSDLLEQVGKVVFVASEVTLSHAIENVSDSVKRQFGFEGTAEYSIVDFRRSKREALVRKVCEIEEASTAAKDKLILVINQVAMGHKGMFEANPEFIIHYAKYLLAHQGAMSANDVVPMTSLYRVNISNVVKEALKKSPVGHQERYIEKVMVILSEIAYEMHQKKCPVTSTERIAKIIRDYRLTHGVSLDFNALLDVAIKAHILTLDQEGRIRFTSVNQLAFFVADKIERNMSKGPIDNDLSYLLDNIYLSINERILLFLAYLRDNNELPLELCVRLDSMLRGLNDADFESQAFSFLSVDIGFQIGRVDSESAKQREQIADEVETQFVEHETFEYGDIYEPEESEDDSLLMAMTKALKYLEMLGRSYVAQFVYSEITTKELIRETLFMGSSKILGTMLERVSDRFDQIVDLLFDTIKEEIKDSEKVQDVKRSDVEYFIRSFVYVFCAAVLDTIAYSCSEQDTVNYLCEYEDESAHANALKICMKENGLESPSFIEQLCATPYLNRNIIERNLAMLVANKHIVNHPSIRYNDIDRIAQQVFGSNSAKKSLIAGKMQKKVRQDEV